jgi:hypothetical protein
MWTWALSSSAPQTLVGVLRNLFELVAPLLGVSCLDWRAPDATGLTS